MFQYKISIVISAKQLKPHQTYLERRRGATAAVDAFPRWWTAASPPWSSGTAWTRPSWLPRGLERGSASESGWGGNYEEKLKVGGWKRKPSKMKKMRRNETMINWEMKIGERRQSYRRERWRRRQASKRRLALHRHLVQLLLVGDYLEIKISKTKIFSYFSSQPLLVGPDKQEQWRNI